MVAETIPHSGRTMDTEEQKTILQNIRYFSRKEQVQYVCHADDESREENHSIFATPKKQKDAPKSTESIKKSPKLVRFNSRPHIYTEDTYVSFDEHLKSFHDRPPTPKVAQKDKSSDASDLPPLRKTYKNNSKDAPKSFNRFSSRSAETIPIQKRISPNASPKTPARRVPTNGSTILSSSPPKPDLLRKVLTRGAFGGSNNSMNSNSEAETEGKSVGSRSRRLKSLRWVSPRPSLGDIEATSPNESARSSSVPRDHGTNANRELMTSPLSTLMLRDTTCSRLSDASSTTSKTSIQSDTASKYPVMSEEEHLVFIKYALSPMPDQVETRGRALTISGGEKPEAILKRRHIKPLKKVLKDTAYSSLEKFERHFDITNNTMKPSNKQLPPLEYLTPKISNARV